MKPCTIAACAAVALLGLGGPAVTQQSGTPQQPATSDNSPAADQPSAGDGKSTLDVQQLFATTCGWCHTDAGRVAGKGPQLMNTTRSDDYIRNRIKNGKEGAMPAFGTMFSDADIDAIIKYIRSLKPDQG
ncbi:MAG: cytochrome c [Methylobacteriaceae bacterium]|nr:cytochrome c [Methylobacteriaceae bacterium]MBV9247057.1 cytochrome c [Methylobacteriaceae bacterium]MBV9637128.1 cytochrome c [Methylobacteriaceae bacterium]